MGTPGPSTISLTAVGAAFGLRRSLGYVLGLIVGTTVVLLAVATGIVAMLLSMPRLAPVLTVASAVYIVFLAVQIARAPPLSRQDASMAAPSFAGGLLLAVANPKAYVAIGTVFAGATLAGSAPTTEAVLKTAILTLMIIIIHVVWLLAGASLSQVLSNPVTSRIVNVAFAVILVVTSLLAVIPHRVEIAGEERRT
jgi:threonine/homoserine/homoserine lactone efflux protein